MLFNFMLSLVGMLLTIFIVVGVHEGAHFAMARMLGIKVLCFSIGFGKTLYRWRDKKGTEFLIAAIPLGGYVKLLDESEGLVEEHEKHLAFNRQSLIKRMTVVAAGPFSNLVMAALFYWIIFVVGFETAIPLIGSVSPHSIASEAGLKPQQEIVSIDGHPTRSWSSVALRLIIHTGDQDTTTFETSTFPATTTSPLSTHVLNLASWQMNDLKPDPLSSLGFTPYEPPIPLVIGKIKAGSPAAESSLQVGDKILSINGKTIKTWDKLMVFVDKHPGEELKLLIARDQRKLKLTLTVGNQYDLGFRQHGFLGISPAFEYPPQLLRKIQYGPLEAMSYAVKEVVQLSYINLLLFGKLVTHKLSPFSLGGPITIFESAGSAFKYGALAFLGFLAFLNVALGVINFFPIPGLDGGHLLFQIIEAILRRPVSVRAQTLCYRLGFIFLILLLAQAFTNDLLRLWG